MSMENIRPEDADAVAYLLGLADRVWELDLPSSPMGSGHESGHRVDRHAD